MRQRQEAIEQNLAERLCWQALRLETSQIARHLYRKQVVNEAYLPDAGALVNDFLHFLQPLW